MVAITVILAAVIAAFVFGMGPPKSAPDIHFSNVEANTSKYISATVTGGGNVTLDSIKWLIDNSEKNPATDGTFFVNGAPGGTTTRITGGDRIVIYAGTVTWVAGQEVKFTAADKATGQLLADVTVRVKSG
jgi:hypothetical protein